MSRTSEKPLKQRPRRKRTGAEADAQAAWHAATLESGCQVCPNLPTALQRVCDGPVQGHHIVEKQTLKRRDLEDQLWNLDNHLGVCERAHRRHTARVEKIPRSLLPPAAEAFALEHGLIDVLERAYER